MGLCVMASREDDQVDSNQDDAMQGEQLTRAVTEQEAAGTGPVGGHAGSVAVDVQGPTLRPRRTSVRYLESGITQHMDACAVVPKPDRRASMR